MKTLREYIDLVTLVEGGWDTTVTQGTVIKPQLVKAALAVVEQYVNDFNVFLSDRGLGRVEMGKPTGSSAYWERDLANDPERIYGDIDLQMIAPPVEGLSYGQFTAHWNKLADDFVKTRRPAYIEDAESKPGHPIFKIGPKLFVQVDLMWHEEKMRDWGAARVTPEHGVKGSLFGNMFSVFGELLDMSIQHAGVQLKIQNGERVPFSKQKDTEVVTVTANPRTYMLDTFKYLYERITGERVNRKTAIAPLLKEFPGNDVDDVRIQKLVNGVRGFAQTCEMHGLFGQGDLAGFTNAQDFINKFWQRYEEKALVDLAAKKREKASTPDAVARAQADKEKIMRGLAQVKGYFV